MFDQLLLAFIPMFFAMDPLGILAIFAGLTHDLSAAKKKKIIGIETVDEQLSALNSLDYQEQADLLVKEIHAFEENKSEGTDIVKFYLDQNLDSLAANDADAQMPEKFYKALVTDRNERMASRISDFIKEQSTFIAVGALHLPKERGVINLLRQKGFTVEAANK